jgi:prolipoprotein diacylglyceryltransferase
MGISDNEVKVSIIVAIVLVLTAFINFRISAALATAYLIGYGVNRMRKQRLKKEGQ